MKDCEASKRDAMEAKAALDGDAPAVVAENQRLLQEVKRMEEALAATQRELEDSKDTITHTDALRHSECLCPTEVSFSPCR